MQRPPAAQSWKDGTAGSPEGKPVPRSAEHFLSSELPAPPLGAAPGLDPQGVAFSKGDLKRRGRGGAADKGVHSGVARSPERRSERSVRRGTGEMDLCSLGW